MISTRARDRRINQGVFISGSTGSGKSRMAERLAKPWKRVIYVDPTRSFEAIDARVHSYAEATAYFEKHWAGKFRVALTFSNDEEYTRFFGLIYRAATATHGSVDNVCLVLDEVDLWSNPRKIDPSISRLLRYGRHYGICWIAVCRADVETHRDVRMNATEILLFRQGMLSPEMRRMLESAGNVRGESLLSPAQLTRWNFDGDAKEGENFLALPDPFATWLPSWEALAKARAS